MNTVLLLTAVVAACVGAPQYSSSASVPSRYTLPSGSSSSSSSSSSSGGSRSTRGPVVAIVRDDRVNPEGGAYSFTMETADGISRQESGSPVPTQDGVVTAMSGEYSFTLPDGQLFTMKYVADQNGFQAQSPFLPVAPAFPHPIPAHALEQIEFARQQRERGVSPGTGRYNPPSPTPAPSYRAPTPSPTYRQP